LGVKRSIITHRYYVGYTHYGKTATALLAVTVNTGSDTVDAGSFWKIYIYSDKEIPLFCGTPYVQPCSRNHTSGSTLWQPNLVRTCTPRISKILTLPYCLMYV